MTDLDRSPLRDDRRTTLHHRERGSGVPVLLLHGGWGYGAYPFDAAMEALAQRGFRAMAPDRSGYGRSIPVDRLPLDFHARAAQEMRAFLDASGAGRTLLWGHSDGAVIALHMALQEPARFPALVAEATHLWKRKPRSRAFFETCVREPDAFGARIAAALEADHGARWRDVVRMNGRAWLTLADASTADDEDLYQGRLGDVRARVLLLHGARDPRTEPGEWDALRQALPKARAALMAEAAHAPHAERHSADGALEHAVAFLSEPRDGGI